MRGATCTAAGLLLVLWMGTGSAAKAEEPVTTLWNFLGIPQGIHKIEDAVLNLKGNHPNWERKPALKAIADPENLKAENLAIKKAAEIKIQEDLAPQKIKAIKYLAEVGCACHKGVDEALAAALDDCTEKVRYEAAIALCEASGDPCSVCGGTCCGAEVMTKLEDMAYGRDANGCYKEPSARVRAAARNALNACQRKMPVGEPTPVPKNGREVAPEIAPETAPETTRVLPPAPQPQKPGGYIWMEKPSTPGVSKPASLKQPTLSPPKPMPSAVKPVSLEQEVPARPIRVPQRRYIIPEPY